MTWDEIRTKFYERTGTNSTSMPAALLNVYIQPAVSKAIAKILIAGGRWQFDDSNRMDLPIATANLVASQGDYSLSALHLAIERVELKDANGNWKRLTPIDQQDLKGARESAMAAYKATPGIPEEYDILGSSLVLKPAPSYSLASALRVFFSRAQLDFDFTDEKFTDDTGSISSSPGFNSLFHDLIPLIAAYDYCVINLPELVAGYAAQITSDVNDLTTFYTTRNKDERRRLGANVPNAK